MPTFANKQKGNDLLTKLYDARATIKLAKERWSPSHEAKFRFALGPLLGEPMPLEKGSGREKAFYEVVEYAEGCTEWAGQGDG